MITSKTKNYSEIGRKLLHISMVAFAFLLRYLSWEAALALAAAAFLHNLFILPIYTKKFYREGTPKDIGIIFYPVAVFLVLLFFPEKMFIAAAIWAIMSFGDGFATIFGIKFGRKKLPWNENKSWAGSIAYLIAGTAGASLLIWWTMHPLPSGESTMFYYVLLPFILTFISALFESLPFGLNDNLLVPLVGAFTAYIIMSFHPYIAVADWDTFKRQIICGFGVTVAVGLISFALGLVSKKGAVSGVIAGTIIYAFSGCRGFLLLLTFFLIASALTKLGYEKKAGKGLAQEDKGARGTKHVAANVSLAIILAVIWFFSGLQPVFAVAMAAALATALSDTSSSEIGQLFGRHTFMITNFKKAKPGADGAVSLEGTFAGLLGAFAIAAVAFASGFVRGALPFVIIGAAGFIGNLIESYMNALINNKSNMDNELMNFLNTMTGAGIAIILYNLFV
jgi:uncharacterized protein (TIGR00297 family)